MNRIIGVGKGTYVVHGHCYGSSEYVQRIIGPVLAAVRDTFVEWLLECSSSHNSLFLSPYIYKEIDKMLLTMLYHMLHFSISIVSAITSCQAVCAFWRIRCERCGQCLSLYCLGQKDRQTFGSPTLP